MVLYNQGTVVPVCLLFLALPLVSAQSFNMGSCPTPSIQSNFSLSKFLGKWYEIQRLPSWCEKGTCIEANLALMNDGNSKILFSQTVNGKEETMAGVLYQDSEFPAKVGISYYYFLPKTHWWILSTDYSTVAVVYSCNNFFDMFHVDYAWILSRTRSLSPRVLKASKDLFTANGIDISKMMVSNQTGCGMSPLQ